MVTKNKTLRSVSSIKGCDCAALKGVSKPSNKCRVQVKKRVKICGSGKNKNKCETKIIRMFKLVSCKKIKRKR